MEGDGVMGVRLWDSLVCCWGCVVEAIAGEAFGGEGVEGWNMHIDMVVWM